MLSILQTFKSSVSSKIITLLVVCLFSIITVNAVISYLLQRQELIRERNDHAVHAVERLAFIMSAPLWNFDLEQLDKLASAEMKGEGSIGVLVWTNDGRLLMERMHDSTVIGRWSAVVGELYQGKQPPYIYVVSNEILRDQQLLGSVQLVYDDHKIDNVLSFLLINELIKSLFLLVATSAVLYLGLSRVFLDRLKTVYSTAVEFAGGNLSKRIKINENDEIGVLSETLNLMADRIGDKINQLESAFDEVKQLKVVLDDIINSMPSIIVVVNHDSEIMLWNNRAELFTGIPSSLAQGKKSEALLPQFVECLQHIGYVLDSQQPYIIERHPVLRGEEYYRYSVQLFPLASEMSRQVVVRIDDITEHARLEEIMIQNEKMTMVGGLAAGMAHEINNPLAAMLQNAQNIERRISADLPANSEAAREAGVSLESITTYLDKRGIPGFITQIRDAGSRIAKIINTMLRFTNKSESRKEPVALSMLLEQTLELAASDYDMKKQYDFQHIVIIREYHPLVPAVLATASEIEHVLLNILKNAAQAASTTRNIRVPQIILRTRCEGQMSVVDIEDNGPGMRENIQRRVFEPFYSTREVGEGTGLGLSIAYAILTNIYNGRIEVQSRTGEGTCFTISIPSIGSNT
jgi:PAS domain S-box-containing protein